MKMLTLNHADRLMNNNIVFNNIIGCADLAKQKTVAESAQCGKQIVGLICQHTDLNNFQLSNKRS